ncbi:MAG: translation initiation factor eIF-1A [Candidatus Micrarchaeia archaeon]
MFQRPRRDFGAKRATGGPMIPGMPPEAVRVRMPRPGEILGVVSELLGGSRMRVQCQDNFERMCRIPGKIRKKLWIKTGDYVLIVPWTVESNEKGDIAYRYTYAQVDVLRRKGIIK